MTILVRGLLGVRLRSTTYSIEMPAWISLTRIKRRTPSNRRSPPTDSSCTLDPLFDPKPQYRNCWVVYGKAGGLVTGLEAESLSIMKRKGRRRSKRKKR
jgi:hypothetical protein